MHTSWIPVVEGLGFAYMGFPTCLQPVGSVSALVPGLWGIQNNKQAGEGKTDHNKSQHNPSVQKWRPEEGNKPSFNRD